MQAGAIQHGDSVIVVDDLIATGTISYFVFRVQCIDIQLNSGGSAKAAGELVAKQGGVVVEYVFLIELPFLNGREKLNAPVYSMIQSNE
jgi:adenine phosphoribosyltransferase